MTNITDLTPEATKTTKLYLDSYNKGAGNTASMLGGRGALSDKVCIENTHLVVDYKEQVRNITLMPVQITAFASRFIFERIKSMNTEKQTAYLDSIEAGYMEQAHESSCATKVKSKKVVNNPLGKVGKVVTSEQYLRSTIKQSVENVDDTLLASTMEELASLSDSSTKDKYKQVVKSLQDILISDESLASYLTIKENEEAAAKSLKALTEAGFLDIKKSVNGYSSSVDLSQAKTFQESLIAQGFTLTSYNVNLTTGLLDITFSSAVKELEL